MSGRWLVRRRGAGSRRPEVLSAKDAREGESRIASEQAIAATGDALIWTAIRHPEMRVVLRCFYMFYVDDGRVLTNTAHLADEFPSSARKLASKDRDGFNCWAPRPGSALNDPTRDRCQCHHCPVFTQRFPTSIWWWSLLEPINRASSSKVISVERMRFSP